jgi:hypothetical protein
MSMFVSQFPVILLVQGDSKLLSGLPWRVNENSDSNLGSLYIIYVDSQCHLGLHTDLSTNSSNKQHTK